MLLIAALFRPPAAAQSSPANPCLRVPAPAYGNVAPTAGSPEQTVLTTTAGRLILLVLPTTPGTGYRWSYRTPSVWPEGAHPFATTAAGAVPQPTVTPIPPTEVLLGTAYRAPSRGAGRLGTAGEEMFVFLMTPSYGRGPTHIVMQYARPWKSAPPAKVLTFTVNVCPTGGSFEPPVSNP